MGRGTMCIGRRILRVCDSLGRCFVFSEMSFALPLNGQAICRAGTMQLMTTGTSDIPQSRASALFDSARLVNLREQVRGAFVLKWAVRHVSDCQVCSSCFAIGLDGKRGMKRFLCARQFVFVMKEC